jgi:hypothetical protein
MDRYALDTNVLREDYRFRRNPGQLLLREARHEEIRLLMPRLCLDEAANLYREDLEEAFRESRKAARRLRGLGATTENPAGAVDSLVADYRAYLEALLRSANAEILPYPTVGHEHVAVRALSRRQPFDHEGRNGYRDVLLWESLLAAADASHPIILISHDSRAFGPNRKLPGLAEELSDEVEAAGFPRDAIRRISTVAEFTGGLPSVAALEVEAEHLIASDADIRQVVENGMEEETLDYDESGTFLPGLDLKIREWWVHEVVDISPVRVMRARELDDGRVALDLRADINAVLHASVRVDDLTADSAEFDVVEYDGDEATVSVNRTLESSFEGIWETEEGWLAPGHAYQYIAY